MFYKFISNMGLSAFNRLGSRMYVLMLFKMIINFTKIFKSKSLIPLDVAMSQYNMTINYGSSYFKINTPYIDNVIVENSYAYGAVRELYIRDCYFNGHVNIQLNLIKNVIDLGGNRGLFSTMCTSFCDKILIVEAQPAYNEIIKYNIDTVNNFNNYSIVNAFVGGISKLQNSTGKFIDLDDVVEISNMPIVDFMKIDIEGSEFTLFNENMHLHRIRYISMEIHPMFGDVTGIILKLNHHNFNVLTTTENFKPTIDPDKVSFLYARNMSFSY